MAEKKEVYKLLDEMSDNIEIEELMYKLYVLDKIKKGIMSADKGDFISHEELEDEIKHW